MRIAICAAQVPFARGGAEIHVDGLHRALLDAGHSVEVIALPFKWYPPSALLKSALAWRMIDITESDGRPIDLAICTKFPSWAVRHPRKIAWIIHQYRQAYDWFGTEYSDLTGSPEDLALRRRIRQIDARGLGECRARFANSQNTANRLKHFNGLDAVPLHVPVQLTGLRPVAYEPYIFSVSRFDRTKRIDLLLKAVAQSSSDFEVVIAGDGPERESLERLAGELGLTHRVRFPGRIPDDEVVGHYNNCRAVFYGPIDEDFGLATLEAFTAGKPVVTVADSGGVLELVRNGETGLIADSPDPESIASLLDQTIWNIDQCRSMGTTAKAVTDRVTWDGVVSKLLESTDG
ncbi:MAG: glycosyltransferase family 4 protein [Thermomicrobiaceae bacterium]